MKQVVVVGASLAGVSAVAELRSRGFGGRITMIGAEPDLPYTRPPLSKEALRQGIDRSRLQLQEDSWYADNEVTTLLGVAAVALDTRARAVLLADGTTVNYGGLVLATGLEHRPDPLLDGLPNSRQLRTADDAERLAATLSAARHLVVVGAGFVGLEVAATARCLGLEVTVVDIAPQPMGRAFGPVIGEWFRRRHEDAGVRLLTSETIDGAEEAGTRTVLLLGSGETLTADAVLVCTGSPAPYEPVPSTPTLTTVPNALNHAMSCR